MHLLKAAVIAFSIYSKIPMPQFEWKDEDMKYMMCFFPWIGAVIGVFLWLWGLICDRFAVGELCYTLVGAAAPLLVTGGFHVDGFLDTMDAFHSYQSREKKMEILKDSHIGAFAVIMLAIYGMIYLGAFSMVNGSVLKAFCGGFFLARCLSGMSVMTFPTAKKEGMVYTFQSSAHKNRVTWILILEAVCCSIFLLGTSPVAGGSMVVAAGLSFAWYYRKCKKELGGITGDTAGCFVLVCEESMLVVAALCSILMDSVK